VSGREQVTVTGANLSIPKQSALSRIATCPAGKTVLGGGFRILADPDAYTDFEVIENAPVAANSWSVTAWNKGNKTQTVSITAVAICAIVQ